VPFASLYPIPARPLNLQIAAVLLHRSEKSVWVIRVDPLTFHFQAIADFLALKALFTSRTPESIKPSFDRLRQQQLLGVRVAGEQKCGFGHLAAARPS
jgi:hypothetical protein